MREVYEIAVHAKIVGMDVNNLSTLAAQLSNGNHPGLISFKKDGKFFRVINREWHENRA
jgi:hypothetical protein